MGIRVDFLIKHVRPYGMEAWAAICQPTGPGSLAGWLLANGVAQAEIDIAFNAWAALALTEINDANMPQFIAAANLISQARWGELYHTSHSTILFLNQPLLNELSYDSSTHRNQVFDFDPAETIPLAVTIHQSNQPAPTTVMNAYGATVQADANGDCFHFIQLNEGEHMMHATSALSSESARRLKRSATSAEAILENAGTQASIQRTYQFFGIEPNLTATATSAPAGASTPSQGNLNALLNGVGTAPGASTIVTVPSTPASGDIALVQNVQTLDSYIAVLTALVMYNNHPAAYDLSNPQDAAQFVIDLANARNFVISGGTVKAIPMYLSMSEATTQSFNKTTTSADLHMDLLAALFATLNLPAAVLTELDGILTEIAGSLQSLQLSFTTQTQTLDHFVSFYYLTPVPGSNPPINQMNVEFIFLQLAQSSWKASVGKSSVSSFTLNMTTTRTTCTMNSGIVAGNSAAIVSSLMSLTGNDASTISEMTKMKGVQT